MVLLGAAPSNAGSPGHGPQQTQAPQKRHTFKELRDKYVVKQQSDFSCGAAALATLLTYYYEDPTSEEDAIELLTEDLAGDEKARKQLLGYSLLDLKRAAEKKGYRAGGFKLSIQQLRQIAAPVVVHVEPLGYKHFAVLRGVVGDRVLLADPSRGNLRMTLARFRNEWSGIVFVLGREGEEHLADYPLAVPGVRDIQPERLRVERMMDLGVRATRRIDVMPAIR